MPCIRRYSLGTFQGRDTTMEPPCRCNISCPCRIFRIHEINQRNTFIKTNRAGCITTAGTNHLKHYLFTKTIETEYKSTSVLDFYQFIGPYNGQLV